MTELELADITNAEAAQTPADFLPGFADLPEFIASDHHVAVFRRFESLSIRNLLYLQIEIHMLNKRLREHDECENQKIKTAITENKDGEAVDMLRAARDWETFKREAEGDNNEKLKKKMEIVVEVRKKLQEYR